MNARLLISNLAAAFGAQGVSFLCSIVATLLLPKMLGVEEFAYWQLFVFYTSYVSFFQLGLNDGIYLQHGGESRETLDKSLIHGEMRVGFCYQFVSALLIALYALLCEVDENRVIVVIAASVYLVISNMTFFVSYVFQAINETKIASCATVVNRGFYLVALVGCLLLRIDSFEVYLSFYIVAQVLSLAYCLWRGRFLLESKPLALKESLGQAFSSMRLGIVLTVANVSGMLIIGMSRFVIDNVWGVGVFGEVSLSLSIVNFAIAFISQASMVLFPALRSVDRSREKFYYESMRDGLSVILPAAVLLYAPLRWAVGMWLPQYSDSLLYLAFLFPVCLFEAHTNLTVLTFLKVRSRIKTILCINLLSLALAVLAQVVAFCAFRTPTAAILASLFGVVARYVVGTLSIGKLYQTSNLKAMVCMLVETVAFMACAYWLSLPMCFLMCVVFLAIHFVVMRAELCALLRKVCSLAQRLGDCA